MNCITTEATLPDYRFKTNLYIVLDASWQYQAVYPALSYLLDNIEVSKYGSSVTLLSAFDGDVIVNKTFSISDFHTYYTLAKHQSCKYVYWNIKIWTHRVLHQGCYIIYGRINLHTSPKKYIYIYHKGSLPIYFYITEHKKLICAIFY